VTGWAGRANRALLPLAALSGLVALLDLADWGAGPARAAGLALAAWALAVLWRRPLPPASGARPFLLAALVLSLLRLAPALGPGPGRSPNDIGATTARAVNDLDMGRPIYAVPVDPQRDVPRADPGFGYFLGYKYGPLTPRYYAPFLSALDFPRGLYAGNALLLAAAAALAALLARRAAGSAAALAAAAATLLPGFVPFELFSQGVNDLLPTALALSALLAAARGFGVASGLLLGLSMAAKPLPGALFLLLLPGTVRAGPFALGLAGGLAPYLPDLWRTPRELVANLVLFNLARPPDSTGLAAFLPGWAAPLPVLASAALVAAAAWAYHRGRRTPADLAAASALVATLFLAGGKLIHRNYLLWWLPLAAAALGALCYREALPLPRGEGRGEGARAISNSAPSPSPPGRGPG